MSAPDATSPFQGRTVIGMVLVGMLGFVILLYALGRGGLGDNANDGGAHAGGKGLNGYAALVALLRAEGHDVQSSRSKGALTEPGLLVLTPPPAIDGKELQQLVDKRRYVGPTMIVAPKWSVEKARGDQAKNGWVVLDGTTGLQWKDFHDEIGVSSYDPRSKAAGGWKVAGRSGPLPEDGMVQSAAGDTLVPLVESGDGRILAGYLKEDGYHPALEKFAGYPYDMNESEDGDSAQGQSDAYPIVLVFEPDLLDNWGMADPRTAAMASALVAATAEGSNGRILFDLTQSGHGGQQNLLTLAFRPPFLAATLCLLMAGLAIAWRGFNRFGPPRRKERAIALGKSALVENSAGVIRRAGRLHLVTGPYADAARERVAALLGLPRHADGAAVDAAIERRGLSVPQFSRAAAELRQARKPHEVARRAAVLQSIERALM